ncbi:MAG: excinuclease ABC subunit UvrA [Bacilli bacterium]|nr:excinuclease ABC subunit UvrA [Bacilli bacterium]
MDKIIIKGARENNLKNVSLELPKNKLIVMTGVSGSGKSSLAFDTIYAEGERRYMESLSAYARQFLGNSEKPDVDSIEGLSPAISIDQKTTSKNPRSTVGTVTEIYDYLRLLFARVGTSYCPNHHIPITRQSVEEMVTKLKEYEEGTKMIIMSPVVDGEKGTHKELLENLRKEGYIRVRINEENYDLSEEINLEKNKKDKIEVIIDRIILKEESLSRLTEAIESATKLSNGKVIIEILGENHKELVFSEHFACPYCEFSLAELEPRTFSFNAPYGACPDCKGLGVKLQIDEDLIIPDKSLSINEGCIKTLNDDQDSIDYKKLECVCKHYKINMDKPFNKLTKKEQQYILYGTDEIINFKYQSKSGNNYNSKDYYEGIINNLERRYMETSSTWIRDWLENYMVEHSCETCEGARLKEEVLTVLIGEKNIYEVTCMSIKELIKFFDNLKLSEEKTKIADLILKEIKARLSFLANVGLEYLTLSRSAATLSGGESQRIRLATQIGSRLTGVLYVLDEPSIGLHQRDNEKLIKSMQEMRDLGNTLIVVEHDTDTMLAADYLVDIGPGAGENGGTVMAHGTPKEVMKDKKSLTGQYLSGKRSIEVPQTRRKGNKKCIQIKGAASHNLKNIDVKIPLGTLTCITGVSGSGKSSLINDIMCKEIAQKLYKSKEKPGKHKKMLGIENLDKLVAISQNPIGRTPRSNPATYTGVFDDIRELFTTTKEAKMHGFEKNRFSFNVKGGRCEACRGDGVKKIEMHFLPDVYVPCEICHGTRYNKETLSIKYKEKNIAEVLEMRVTEALKFFENIPKIKHKLQVLEDVGLGYIKLGQSAPTLSGGEAERVKLAKELQKKATGKTLFVLDEPTTGLHMEDIKCLLAILHKIVDNKDTVVVIEHNLDVIKTADYIIDLGPEGGDLGGEIVAEGTPEEIIKNKASYTGKFLEKMLENG